MPASRGAAIAVAPMEGVTGFPMRLWLALCSAPAAQATPFLRVTATYPQREVPPAFAPELFELRGALPYELVPQLMAAEPDDFLRTWELFADRTPFMDLNCGCPSPTCVGKGAGSSLLRDPEDFHRSVERLAVGVGPGRLGVKMRTGFQEHGEFPALLHGLRALPLARLTVHGRTRPQGYKGRARWDLIGAAAAGVAAPVVASGDVVDAASLEALLHAAPGVTGVIVGRGALRNPWVFEELRSGGAVALPPRALLAALSAYAALTELAAVRFEALFALVEQGLFAASCGADPEAWERADARIRDQLPAGPEARATVGRVKMLWSYLRSSLPGPFFEPRVLRAPTLESLLGQVRTLCAAHGSAPLPLRHDPERDWLYAGAGKTPPACAPTPPA